MKPDILEDLLHQELRSLYSAEKQMCQALAKMAQAACHPKVRELLKERLGEGEEQAGRLERMAGLMGKVLVGTKCPGIKQLLEDEARESLFNAHARNESYDAGLVSVASRFIRHEIDRYELAAMLASRLGLDEVEALLRRSLNEQKALATRLTRLANALKSNGTVKSATANDTASASGRTLASSMRVTGRVECLVIPV